MSAVINQRPTTYYTNGKSMRVDFEDAAWLWLESKPWAVTPELLFHSKALIIEEAAFLRKLRVSGSVGNFNCLPALEEYE